MAHAVGAQGADRRRPGRAPRARSTSRRSTPTSTSSAATRCSRRWARARCWARRELLEAMPPFMAGGEMIREVHLRRATFNEIPWKFEAGTPDVAAADRARRGRRVPDRARHGAGPRPRAGARGVRAGRRCATRVPGVTLYGPSAEERGGVVAFNVPGRPSPRRGPDPRPVRASRSAPGTTARCRSTSGSMSRPRPAPASTSTRHARTSTPWSRACARSSGSSATDATPSLDFRPHGRPVPRLHPRALPPARITSASRGADDHVRGLEPAVRRPHHADARHPRRGRGRGRPSPAAAARSARPAPRC